MLGYREVIDQPLDDQMNHVSPAKHVYLVLQDDEDAARRSQSQPPAQERSKPAARARSEFRRRYEWCEVPLKIDRATAVTMSRRGARGHRTKRKDRTFHRRNATPCTTHHYTPTSTARAGALMFHHPAWVEHHTGGFRSTPTVPPC